MHSNYREVIGLHKQNTLYTAKGIFECHILRVKKLSIMVVKMITKRRRLIAHVATCTCLVYLLWQLTLKNGDVTMTVRHHRSAIEKSEVVVPATEDVKIEIKRLFKKTDTTADGKITKKELAWAVSK